jgi:hypothetical protein
MSASGSSSATVKLDGKLQEIFAEDFHRELSAIQSPEAKRLFVLSKAIYSLHLRMGEYVALIEAADLTGHYAVRVLFESCLAEEAALIERTRQFICKTGSFPGQSFPAFVNRRA